MPMVFPLHTTQSSFSFQVISEIIESGRAHDYTDVVLVHEHRGVPDGLIVCHLPFGPTAYFGLLNVASIITAICFACLIACMPVFMLCL